MARINIYPPADELSGGDGYDKRRPLGWFDPDDCIRFEQDTEWDGNNMIGVITGSQWIDECLYRTKGGKWVRAHDAHRYMNGPVTYEFLTDDEARDWLLSSQMNDEAVTRYFGEIAEEEDRRPGRPTVGEPVNVRLGEELQKMVDEYAAEKSISRAEAIRRLTTDAVTRRRAAR